MIATAILLSVAIFLGLGFELLDDSTGGQPGPGILRIMSNVLGLAGLGAFVVSYLRWRKRSIPSKANPREMAIPVAKAWTPGMAPEGVGPATPVALAVSAPPVMPVELSAAGPRTAFPAWTALGFGLLSVVSPFFFPVAIGIGLYGALCAKLHKEYHRGFGTALFAIVLGVVGGTRGVAGIVASSDLYAGLKCRSNLQQVGRALEDYRGRHREFPPNLEALVSEGLVNAQVLECPLNRSNTGSVESSYVYSRVIAEHATSNMIIVREREGAHRGGMAMVLLSDGRVQFANRRDLESFDAVVRLRESVRGALSEVEAFHANAEEGVVRMSMVEAFTPIIKNLETLQKQATGDDARVFGVLIAWYRRNQELQGDYMNAIKTFQDAGGVDAKTLSSRDAVWERTAMLRAARKVHEPYYQWCVNLEKRLLEMLIESGIDAERAERERRTILKSFDPEQVLRVQEYELDLLHNMQALLDILEREWGRWQIQDESQLVFEADDVAREYTVHFKAIQETGNKQSAVHAAMIENARRNSG